MGERFPAGIGGRVTGSNKLNPLQLNPRLVRGAVEAAVLHHLPKQEESKPQPAVGLSALTCRRGAYLSQEGDDSLGAVLVHVRQVDLVAEQHQPLAQLDGGQHHPVGGPAVLAVVVEGLQQEFRGGGAGEVQTDNLVEGETSRSTWFWIANISILTTAVK